MLINNDTSPVGGSAEPSGQGCDTAAKEYCGAANEHMPFDPVHCETRLTILVAVEDSEKLDALSLLLKQLGHEVFPCWSDLTLLTTLAARSPHRNAPGFQLVISDLSVPGLASFLKRLNQFHLRVPLVVINASRNAATETTARELGAVGVLHGPLDLWDVVTTVRDTITDEPRVQSGPEMSGLL